MTILEQTLLIVLLCLFILGLVALIIGYLTFGVLFAVTAMRGLLAKPFRPVGLVEWFHGIILGIWVVFGWPRFVWPNRFTWIPLPNSS